LALPPINMSDESFVREVDEELQRDTMLSLWKRWGKIGIGAIVALVLAWGGWLYWTHRQNETRGAEAEQLVQVIENLNANNEADAAPKLAALAKSDSKGYRAAAMMTQAALALSKSDTKFAIETYGKVVADTTLSQDWRDLALIRQTALEFDTMKPEAIVARLKPLAVPGNAWFGSAGEMAALAYARMDKPALAAKMFEDMAKDEQVPESIKARAKAMASSLAPAPPPPTTSATKEDKQ
jgi:hypothetical protein